jgi:hypothetical protein
MMRLSCEYLAIETREPNRINFLEVSGGVMEWVDPISFADPMTAAMKALGMT